MIVRGPAGGDWVLRQHVNGYDWQLTNATASPARRIYIAFEGIVDGQPWEENVTPVHGLVGGVGGFLPSEASLYINTFRSDTVTAVSVRWKTRLGRSRVWRTDVG